MDGLPDVLHDLTTPPPAGNPVDRVLARVRRDRRRRSAVAVTLAVAAVAAIPLLSSAVSGPAKNVPATYPVVPWKFLPAPANGAAPVGSNEGADAPYCEAADMTIELGAGTLHGETMVIPVTLTNNGADCQITSGFSPPQGRITRGDDVLATLNQNSWGESFWGSPPVVRVRRGMTASSALAWRNCGSPITPWGLTVHMGEGELSAVSDQVVPTSTCTENVIGSPSMKAWTPLNSYGQPDANPQAVLTTELTAPESGHIAEVLHLTLRMSNPSRGAVSLSPCPTWGWSVSSHGNGSGHVAGVPMVLNCAAAPDSIGPGEHLDFALELPLSTGIADGLLKPGTWYVSTGFRDPDWAASGEGETPNIRAVEVLAALPKAPLGPVVDCGFTTVPGTAGALETPDAQVTRASLPTQATVSTDRGELHVDLADDHPCGVAAFASLARQGLYDGMPAVDAQSGRFPHVTFSRQAKQPGFVFPSDVDGETKYPTGTVLFNTTSGGVTQPTSISVVTGPTPYPPEFTPIGRVTLGLDMLQALVPGSDGYRPKDPVIIRSVSLS